jgi:short-subunit dehydrogenase
MDFRGKKYWIVGASEGLGRAMAHQLSDMGVELVVSARSQDRLDSLVAELKAPATTLAFDVTDTKAVKQAVIDAGAVDGMIYAAGAYTPMASQDWDAAGAELMCEVNFMGAVRILGGIVPGFAKRDAGHIVLIGSLAGFRGLPNAIGYGASKAGLLHMAETLYADLRKTNVKVQVINPGFIKTRLTDKNEFDMPFIMTPEQAAAETIGFMGKKGWFYSFPKLFSLFFRASRFLPDWVFYRLF